MKISTLPPDVKLLLASCRLGIKDDDHKATIDFERTAREGAVDWRAFTEMGIKHRVQPLIYRGILREEVRELVPEAVQHTFKLQMQHNAQRTLRQTAELLRLHQRFTAAGLGFLTLKGPVLAQRIFGRLEMRQFKDLDIAVQREEFEQSDAVLNDAGYQRLTANFSLTPRQKRAFLNNTHHANYYHPQRNSFVELHWRLFRNDHLLEPACAARIMRRTEFLSIGGSALSCLADGDLLLYLCLHGALHQWMRLKWLCDIAALLRSAPAIDWSAWSKRVEQIGLQQPLRRSLLLAACLLHAPLPQVLAQRWKLHSDNLERNVRLPALWSADYEQTMAPGQVNGVKMGVMARQLLLRPNWRYLAAHLREPWAAPEDWRDFPLPDSLFPLYHPLRPLLWLYRRRPQSG